MASQKEIKGRISSVKSTRKITSAMRMVASAKLHRAQNAIGNMLPYQKKMNRILTNFLSTTEVAVDSVFTVQRPVERVAILVLSSNSSLCGAFNSNVLKRFVQTADEYKQLGKENIWVYPIGRKIEEGVKKLGYNVQGSFQDMAHKPSYERAFEVADVLIKLYAAGEIDKVELIYQHFKSAGSQELLRETYLPIDLSRVEKDDEDETEKSAWRKDYIVEPSVKDFISDLLPTVLKLKLFTALLDSNASEHVARMMAMQIATDNADDLIQDLTIQFNKSRQQAITNELLDIIGGSMK